MVICVIDFSFFRNDGLNSVIFLHGKFYKLLKNSYYFKINLLLLLKTIYSQVQAMLLKLGRWCPIQSPFAVGPV